MRKTILLFCSLSVIALPAAAEFKKPTVKPRPKATSAKWDVANLSNPRVDYWIMRLTTDKREKFSLYLRRKKKYEPMIAAKLRARGMPHDLIYLAMIESGFNPRAASAAGARGMWQLIPDTARRFGLRVDKKVDERTDPEKSTDAALDYLQELHDRFDCWYLAAAAYNTGEHRVGRVMRNAFGTESGTDRNYYTIWHHLPGQTRDYVPVMIAAARISKNPAKYGFEAAVTKGQADPAEDSDTLSGAAPRVARLQDEHDARKPTSPAAGAVSKKGRS